MGSVYRGKHVLMDKTVAIKVLRLALAGDDRWWRASRAKLRPLRRFRIRTRSALRTFGEAENGVVFW
jgi:hypothetical protein